MFQSLRKVLFRSLIFITFYLIYPLSICAQICSGSWTSGPALNYICFFGQWIGQTNSNTEPPACPLNPIYDASQTNTFNFDSPVSQFSLDGTTFHKAGEINPKGNNSNYEWETASSFHNYFRLKIINNDNSFTYSKIIRIISSCQEMTYTIIPNPAAELTQIIGLKPNDELLICDILGNRINNLVIKRNGNQINVNALPRGIYVLQIFNSGNLKGNFKFIKN